MPGSQLVAAIFHEDLDRIAAGGGGMNEWLKL
jgi:hypothetical protein